MNDVLNVLVIVLAGVMESEAAILGDEAMLAVGNVYLNRMTTPMSVFGNDPEEVATGFHGYDESVMASQYVRDLAWQLLVERMSYNILSDSTWGCKYILSYQDIDRLWPEEANVIRRDAIWRSRLRVVDGVIYQLYAYRTWPANKIYSKELSD